METKLTNLEQQIMETLQNIAYSGLSYTDELIKESGLAPKIARGVLSSLVQKKVLAINEEMVGLVIDQNDMVFGIDWEYNSETVKEFIANL